MDKLDKEISLQDCLKELGEISDWFESQENVDIEEGIKKAREGVQLLKIARKHLSCLENEFIEIKQELKNM